MARSTQKPLVGGNNYETWKINGAITDVDVGKPVKIASTDLLSLCADGDPIYGWIATVEAGGTSDGKVVVTVQVDGRVYAILSGAATFGDIVEAAANTAAGSANAGSYALVSTHTYDTTTAITLAASLVEKKWKIISGAVTDGATVLLAKV
jgi:hypothetical protein